MNKVLFFDIETDHKKSSIKDIGAILGQRNFHENSVDKFMEFSNEARFLCGHNIVHHDVEILNSQSNTPGFDGKPLIDTLYLSPLLFPKKPYHKLVKDYKLFDEDKGKNNPLYDSMLAKRLLVDEIEEFNELSDSLKIIFYSLLKNEKEFNGFFEYLDFSDNNKLLDNLILKNLNNKICSNVPMNDYISKSPVVCAYLIALLNSDCGESVTPPWVMYQYPDINKVFYRWRFQYCDDPECGYCGTFLDPSKALEAYFGFSSFRKFNPEENIPVQEKVVKSGIKNESFIAVFPTGGGKSIAFQLPALMLGEACRSLTVVVSPLQALMKDQVDNLENNEINKAVTINGLLSPLERSEAIKRVEDGSAHLLYISPESLRLRSMENLLKKRMIARFVIDEAHCFSSWGHDFRVDYLYIGKFLNRLRKLKNLNVPIPVSCFTATAKPAVISDIKDYFTKTCDLELKEYIVETTRKNLRYNVIKCKSDHEKLNELLRIINKAKGPVIVYCSRTKTTDIVANKLKSFDIQALPYHGKMEVEDKKINMDQFMNDEVRVIVATSAFGMGVDKDNITTIVHYDISDSLENYNQETGRAGRKPEINAECYLLFNEDDIQGHFELYYNSRINKKEISQVWKGIKALRGFANKINRSAVEIAHEAGWDTEMYELETKIKSAIAVLEENKFVKRTFDTPKIFADSLLVRDVVQITEQIDRSSLFTEYEKKVARQIIQRIIKDEETRADYLAEILGINLDAVIRIIYLLRGINLLGDSKDLSVYLNFSKGKKNSIGIFEKYREIENRTLKYIEHQPPRISLKELNGVIIENGNTTSSIDAIKKILNYWDTCNFIDKKRLDPKSQTYEIKYKIEPEIFKEKISIIQEAASTVIQYLYNKKINDLKLNGTKISQMLVEFSILELKTNIEGDNILFKNTFDIMVYEKSLLYLNSISSIKLDKGFIIMYRPMTIEAIETNNRRSFTNEDYRKMENFYKQKIEQIHIILEYAKKMMINYEEALIFVNDYFQISNDDFIKKYFPKRKTEIKRPLTPDKFKKIYGSLSLKQKDIIDAGDNRILVAAGPGSGKTHILVHKIASLLTMEDIKPEQFLMLTFSRATAIEFRSRLKKIIGGTANYIDIFTYHSFCFNLHGILGQEEHLNDIIPQTIIDLKDETISSEKLKNKSVLVIDEFQDIDKTEYELIQLLINIAGDIRVLAVGDDDQNIYEFRKASNVYMKNFSKEKNARKFELLINYRSKKNIVQLANQFVKRIKVRLKEHEIQSNSKNNGLIQIHKYKYNKLIVPLVQSLKKNKPTGSTAILTRTNEEAAIIKCYIDNEGLKSNLTIEYFSIRVKDLVEIEYFTKLIQSDVKGSGIITDKLWSSSRIKVLEKFSNSSQIDFILRIIDKFKNINAVTVEDNKSILSSYEWNNFILEMKVNDFINFEDDVITVSTMHKSKGKEFENVIIMLSDFSAISDSDNRLLYVALTRTKTNLQIFTNSSIFDKFICENYTKEFDDFEYGDPDLLTLYMGHEDLHLDFFKKNTVINAIEKLYSGDNIYQLTQDGFFYDSNDKHICKFSKKFKGDLNKWIKKGFKIKDVSIEYIVNWYKKDDKKSYKIVFPKINLEKK